MLLSFFVDHPLRRPISCFVCPGNGAPTGPTTVSRLQRTMTRNDIGGLQEKQRIEQKRRGSKKNGGRDGGRENGTGTRKGTSERPVQPYPSTDFLDDGGLRRNLCHFIPCSRVGSASTSHFPLVSSSACVPLPFVIYRYVVIDAWLGWLLAVFAHARA